MAFFDDQFILRNQSFDGYLFLRFFHAIILLSFVGCCITWPVLIPINATGGGNSEQLDRISFSNIIGPDRLYAHAIVACLFLGFVMLLLARERLFVISLRRSYLRLPEISQRLSSRVVLFCCVPEEALREGGVQKVFGEAATNHWVVSNLDKLESLIQDRNDKATNLEDAQVELIRSATKKHFHEDSILPSAIRLDVGSHDDRPVDEQARPIHKSVPLVGKEVDTIKELRGLLPELTTLIDGLRDSESRAGKKGAPAMFVEFRDQVAAHQACQNVHHHSRMTLWPRFVGVTPKETLWPNLTISPSDRISRSSLAVVFVAATIILWAIPIGIIGAFSNISYLTERFKFLRFLNNLPDPVFGFLQGFVPPYVISEVVSYLPKFFRKVAKAAGAPTTPDAEAKTQQWQFAFQLIQVFLVTTSASGAAAVATQIAKDPSSVPKLLAENLPKASNFYLTYFIIQGTASAANNLLRYDDLFEYLFYDRFFDKTPRQKYARYSYMKGISWGSVYPKFANLAVIAIAYSCIAPLVLGFSTVGFYLYYLSYRHNLIYVIQTKVDTKGAAYFRALQHVLTGVYLSELCLIGLFSASSAKGPTALVTILFIVTVIYHIIMNRIIGVHEKYLPADSTSTNHQQGSDEESVPFLSSSQADNNSSSLLHPHLSAYLPASILDPLLRFLEPHNSYPPDYFDSFFRDSSASTSSPYPSPPDYTPSQLATAYQNPALTSNTPKIWLPHDELDLAKRELEENEKVGIKGGTDEAARVDHQGDVHWDGEDGGSWEGTPVWKEPVIW